MANGVCSCAEVSFGNLGTPNCATMQTALGRLLFVPRYDDNGDRNYFDVTSATLGADMQSMVEDVTLPAQNRIYPLGGIESFAPTRTESVFEEFPSGRKVKINGVGNVTTWAFELVADDAVYGVLRELKKMGCSDVDVLYEDVTGNQWGVLDDVNNPATFRGYALSKVSFDSFITYATETTTMKIGVSFDLERTECVENSYYINEDNLGYAPSLLEALIGGHTTAVEATTTTAVVDVMSQFGNAASLGITGLVAADFVVEINGVVAVATVVENGNGNYTLTYPALTIGDTFSVRPLSNGFDLGIDSFVATL